MTDTLPISLAELDELDDALRATRRGRRPGSGPVAAAEPGGGGTPTGEPTPGQPLAPGVLKRIMRRRAAAIHAYIGANGSGKSATMVLDTLPTLDGIRWECSNPAHEHTAEGITSGYRKVLSTVALLDPETGEPHPLYVPLREWHQVMHAEHLDILFDEVTGIAGSREAMGMPVAVQNILQQLRRRDCLLRWSAPAWARADSIIRSCTISITVCKGYVPDTARLKDPNPPVWLPKRLFRVRTFSAIDFDEWTAAKGAQDRKGRAPIKPEVVQWWWGVSLFKRNVARAFRSYNTLDAVSRVGEVLDGGRCANCGGKRAVPVCKC